MAYPLEAPQGLTLPPNMQWIPGLASYEVEAIMEDVSGLPFWGWRKRKLAAILGDSRAVLAGHFELRSRGHSSRFLQFARIAQYPRYLERVAKYLRGRLPTRDVSVVLTPHKAGVYLGFELARRLPRARHVIAVWENGAAHLRPGFEIKPEDRVLLVNDIATTGRGLNQIKQIAVDSDATVVGAATFACRSPMARPEDLRDELGVPFYTALVGLRMDYREPGAPCPLCDLGLDAVEADDLN
jgi:orotate phosphoribosyltransferase